MKIRLILVAAVSLSIAGCGGGSPSFTGTPSTCEEFNGMDPTEARLFVEDWYKAEVKADSGWANEADVWLGTQRLCEKDPSQDVEVAMTGSAYANE